MRMNCEKAIEILPWLLNGSLEPQESTEVRRHLENCEACREALRDTRQAWKIFGEHLPAESLVQLAYDEAPSGVDPVLAERHLASCPQCAAELEMARMSRRLEEDDRIVTFPARTSRERVRETRTWRAAALAAGLAAVVAAGGWWQTASRFSEVSTLVARNQQTQEEQARLQGQVRSAQEDLARIAANVREPQLNSWTGDVSMTDVVRGQQQTGQEIVIPADVDSTPILEASHEVTQPQREVRIVDAAGKVVWRRDGLRRNPTDDYTITFHPGFLKPGLYTVQLYAPDGRQVETYKVRVK
jgi:anti-sigma factor RsiW